MALIYPRVNQALDINPPFGAEQLSVNGSNWLWTVTAIYAFSFLAWHILAFKPRHGEKIFHYLFGFALLVGAITYYAMASDLGFLVIQTSNNIDDAVSYQIFYSKYINWVVSFPTVIIALGLLSGVPWATIFVGVGLSWTWVISYLVCAFTASNYKWGFFAFGTAAYLALACNLLIDGIKSAGRLGVRNDYLMLAGWLNLLWLLYPIAFGISDGGNVIGVTPSFIFFGILDVLMIPVISFLFLLRSGSWDYGKLNLHFTQYGRVAQGGSYPEKGTAPVAGGVTEPAAA